MLLSVWEWGRERVPPTPSHPGRKTHERAIVATHETNGRPIKEQAWPWAWGHAGVEVEVARRWGARSWGARHGSGREKAGAPRYRRKTLAPQGLEAKTSKDAGEKRGAGCVGAVPTGHAPRRPKSKGHRRQALRTAEPPRTPPCGETGKCT